MPDRYGFDHLVVRGYYTLRCIETGCGVQGSKLEWPEEKRQMHFLSHSILGVDEAKRFIFEGEIRKDICRICNSEFEQVRKRGRPRVVCYVCKPEE